MSVQTNTPNQAIAQVSHNWVTSSTVFNILKPEISSALVKRFGDQNMTGLIDELGGKNPVSALTYKHYEEDWLHETVMFAAHAAGAANAAVTLTLAAAYQYVYPNAVEAPYIVTNAVTTNPLQNRMIVRFPDGTEAYVTNRTTTGADFSPVVLGQNIPQVFTTDVIIITGNAYGESTDQPDGTAFRLIEYNNDMQIYKNTFDVSGSAQIEKAWVNFTDAKGQTAPFFYYKGQLDTYKRARNEREVQMLTGQRLTNTTLAGIDAAAGTTTKTEGLIPYMQNQGNTATYSIALGLGRADWENAILNQLNKNMGARENAVFCAMSITQSQDQWIGSEMKQGAISYGAFGGDKEKYINFGFNSFCLSDYTFHRKTYDVFNTPKMLGATGQPYRNMALVIPMEKTVESIGPEKKKEMVAPLRINYASQNGEGGSYSREWEEWRLGGSNGVYTEGVDRLRINYRSHFGFEAFGANRYLIFTGV